MQASRSADTVPGSTTIQRANSLAEDVYEAIFNQLMALKIAPGERITVDNLVKEFNVSHTPIREALMRLGTEGLVIAESNRGARVKGVSQAEFADLMKTRREVERICLRDSVTAGDAR